MRRIACTVSLVGLTCVGLAFGCTSTSAPDAGLDASDTSATPDANGADANEARYVIETLGTVPYATDDGSRSWTGQHVRITRPDGHFTYVAYYPSDRPGPRPVVVITMPYAGVAWSGEDVDTRWASYPLEGLRHADLDQPDYDGMGLTYYEAHDDAAANSQALFYLLNDFSVVLIYGRFYAGGSARDDVEDMRAGMFFVAEQPATDPTRVGIFGGSWGGFLALQASAVADPRAPASVVVTAYPVSDIEAERAHFSARLPDQPDWFLPYLRRMAGDVSGLRATDLCARLPDATLILHDEEDNLVPFAQTQALVSACGAEVAYWLRATPRASLWSHGRMSEYDMTTGEGEPFPQSFITYSLTYLIEHLATPDQTVLYAASSTAPMRTQLQTVRDAQVAGRDVSFAAPRLLSLCDPRLYLFHDGAVRPGADVVAELVNAVWGTSETAATITATLTRGLPPP